MHVTFVCESCVHIYILIAKTNICRHHKTHESCVSTALLVVSILQVGCGFKTLHKNMQIGCIKRILIFDYVKRLNPFLPICITPRWNCQTTQRHVLNARCAIIHVREKAAFCNIMIPTSIKLKSKQHRLNHPTRARVGKHLSCGPLSTITRRRAKPRLLRLHPTHLRLRPCR
jgi:hypothetical protein